MSALNKQRLKNVRLVRFFGALYKNWRSNRSYTVGRNNYIDNHGVKINTKVQILGCNNRIEITKGAVVKNSLVHIYGNNNTIYIGKDSLISGAELWIEDNNCKLQIGERTFIGYHTHIAVTEDDRCIAIGNDCLFSSHVQLRTGDSHSILDGDGKRINPAQSIVIGNHCWIGEGTKVMKGVELQPDVVVSTGAIVTKSFGPNQLIAGVPAKVVKENISWKDERI